MKPAQRTWKVFLWYQVKCGTEQSSDEGENTVGFVWDAEKHEKSCSGSKNRTNVLLFLPAVIFKNNVFLNFFMPVNIFYDFPGNVSKNVRQTGVKVNEVRGNKRDEEWREVARRGDVKRGVGGVGGVWGVGGWWSWGDTESLVRAKRMM